MKNCFSGSGITNSNIVDDLMLEWKGQGRYDAPAAKLAPPQQACNYTKQGLRGPVGTGVKQPMTASGGNLIGCFLDRNKRAPQCGVALIEVAEGAHCPCRARCARRLRPRCACDSLRPTVFKFFFPREFANMRVLYDWIICFIKLDNLRYGFCPTAV